MNDLRRELAPVTDEAWMEIEDEAKRTLKIHLAARKLVDFLGPLGWKASAVSLGRTRPAGEAAQEGVEMRRRLVRPLTELRAPFTLSRDELDNVSRGSRDPKRVVVHASAIELGLNGER